MASGRRVVRSGLGPSRTGLTSAPERCSSCLRDDKTQGRKWRVSLEWLVGYGLK